MSSVSVIPADSDEEYHSPYDGSLGSAGSLCGRTLILSIFTDDAGTSWDDDSEEDSATRYDTLDNLRISTSYLTDQAARFGADATFFWDWELNPDLSEENAEEASATFCTSHLHLVDSDVIWEKPEEG